MTVFISGDRTLSVLIHIIHMYLEKHVPVASNQVARMMGMSPASMRIVMAELEEKGFLESAHCSAGRIPTAKTLRLYAENLLNSQSATPLSKEDIHVLNEISRSQRVVEHVSQTLADLCRCAGVFFSAPYAPVIDSLRFWLLGAGQAVGILETSCGKTQCHVIEIPAYITKENLAQVGDFLNPRIKGRTVRDVLNDMDSVLEYTGENLIHLACHLLQTGQAVDPGALDIKGYSYLLDSVQSIRDVEQFKTLFRWLENQDIFYEIFENMIHQQRVRVFFSMDDGLSPLQGCSVVMAPYQVERKKGVVGVIGPLHMDYRRVIPIIDGMAKIVERAFK